MRFSALTSVAACCSIHPRNSLYSPLAHTSARCASIGRFRLQQHPKFSRVREGNTLRGLFGSVSLLQYALLVLILFHLFVVFYEEPALTSQFAESYRPAGSAAAGASPRGHFERAPGTPPN
jgi:protein-S-isoprenylcysteine O-methyltransferase Ste14